MDCHMIDSVLIYITKGKIMLDTLQGNVYMHNHVRLYLKGTTRRQQKCQSSTVTSLYRFMERLPSMSSCLSSFVESSPRKLCVFVFKYVSIAPFPIPIRTTIILVA
jgi:hypothetical protein